MQLFDCIQKPVRFFNSGEIGLLVIGHWLLVIGHWLLVIGYWLLVIGHWSLVIGHWLLVIGHWLMGGMGGMGEMLVCSNDFSRFWVLG